MPRLQLCQSREALDGCGAGFALDAGLGESQVIVFTTAWHALRLGWLPSSSSPAS